MISDLISPVWLSFLGYVNEFNNDLGEEMYMHMHLHEEDCNFTETLKVSKEPSEEMT